jgi:hypothetical protein
MTVLISCCLEPTMSLDVQHHRVGESLKRMSSYNTTYYRWKEFLHKHIMCV